MNIKNTINDLKRDTTLMKSSIIALSETWLAPSDTVNLDGFKTHLNSTGSGKGLALFIKDDAFKPMIDISDEKMQLTKVSSNILDIIAVYRSE